MFSAVPGYQLDVIPRSSSVLGDPKVTAATTSSLLLPEQSLEYILAWDSKDTNGESKSLRSSAEPRDSVTTTALPRALPNLVSIWQQVKQAAIASGDYEGAEKIDVPMLHMRMGQLQYTPY